MAKGKAERDECIYRSLKDGIIRCWQMAAKEHWPHERIIEHCNKTLPLLCGARSKLQKRYQILLDGVGEAIYANHYQYLTFCYPHPDTGVITPAVALCISGLVSRVDARAGNHYYQNEDGTFSDKF